MKFRPTRPRPTARSSGIAPRWWWSEIEAGGKIGLGYTYSDASIASLIERKLAEVITARSVFDIAGRQRRAVA